MIRKMHKINLQVATTSLFRTIIPSTSYQTITDACSSKFPVTTAIDGNDLIVKMVGSGATVATLEPYFEERIKLPMISISTPGFIDHCEKVKRDTWKQWLLKLVTGCGRFKSMDVNAKTALMPNWLDDSSQETEMTVPLVHFMTSNDMVAVGKTLNEQLSRFFRELDEFYKFVEQSIGGFEKWINHPSPVIISDDELDSLAESLKNTGDIVSSYETLRSGILKND